MICSNMIQVRTISLLMPEVGTVWRHRKGGLYLVLGQVRIEATEEIAVRYVAVAADGAVTGEEWVRALVDWHAEVPGHGPRFQSAPSSFVTSPTGITTIG